MSRVLVMVGTQKGAFFLWSDEERGEWSLEGPLLKGWEVLHLALDSRRDPVIYAGLGHQVYGPNIQASKDLGRTWTQVEDGPEYDTESGIKLERIWCVAPGRASEPEVLYAGVAEAGLFVSEDSGKSWRGLEGLNQHPTRKEWSPGAGGLCCHTVIPHPENPDRLWVGISAVGVFRSDDAGASWEVKNDGLPIVVPPQDSGNIGSCVHKIVLSPQDPDLLYQQNHKGVFRSTNGADSWERIENGLPSEFGFPMVLHPTDSKTLYVVPLESDEYRFCKDGEFRIYRTRDGGESWEPMIAGMPRSDGYTGVLRHAMGSDGMSPAGIYCGTTGGQLFYSSNDGDSWAAMPYLLPRILSVTASVVD